MRPAKAPPKEKITTESPELADRFNRVLGDTVLALDEAGLKYVFIGGIAASGLGRPRSTHDIDVFVRPEDAELALRALARHGFRTEKTDPVWLYKGWKEEILVDVIFKSKGEIYFDSEMLQRVTTAEYHGKTLRLVAPEDLIIIKALAHSEVTPGHWHDALALLSQATIDWDYLIRRARKAPRRVLSVLLYAQSSDIYVPKHVIDQLYLVVFGDMPPTGHPGGGVVLGGTPAGSAPGAGHPAPAGKQPPQGAAAGAQPQPQPAGGARPALRAVPANAAANQVAALREHLAEDPRLNELDIQIDAYEGRFVLRGEVMSAERREMVERIAREMYPGHRIENQIVVARFEEPPTIEEVK